MKTTAIALIVSLLTLVAVSAFAQPSADWQKVAEAIPLGSRIKVQKLDGARITGTLMRVDSNGVLVSRNTRRPEAPASIPLDQIAKIERSKDGGFSLAKAIAIGAGAGAGVILTLILFAMQLD